MAKISTSSAHEMFAANYMGTYKDTREDVGIRVVLRSDRKILRRTRWFTFNGVRRATRSGGFQVWLTINEEAYARAREGGTVRELVDRVLARRGYSPDVDGIAGPRPAKPAKPEFASLTEKIAWERNDREQRYALFALVVAEAKRAGERAGAEWIPTPMHVVERADPLNDSSPVVTTYAPVMDGACGFAWVALAKGNSSFAHWARKHAGFRSGYDGTQLWVSDFGQSMERKLAYARAYAQTLKDAGIDAYASSRMD